MNYLLRYNLTPKHLEFKGNPDITFTEFSNTKTHIKIFDGKIYLHYIEKDGTHVRKVYDIIPKDSNITVPYEIFYGTVEEKILEWVKQTVREYHSKNYKT